MILHLIKCEVCENTHHFEPMLGPVYSQLPDNWITLVVGNPQTKEGLSYCSQACLAKSLGVQLEPQLAPSATKLRRFWLVNTETADLMESVKWGNGRVSVDVGQGDCPLLLEFKDWEHLKQANPDCGVQWIDQESEDTANASK